MTIYQKERTRICILRRLRSFSVCCKMLHMFFQSAADSGLIYAEVYWGTGIRVGDCNLLNKLIRKAGSVTGVDLEPLELVSERRMMPKLPTIMDNMSQPLHDMLDRMRNLFRRRLILLWCNSTMDLNLNVNFEGPIEQTVTPSLNQT